jgi:hypothetical protein
MKECGVTALSIAISNKARDNIIINQSHTNAHSQKPVADKAIFQAGRLSQPVFAWLVLILVKEGTIDLDRPLVQYIKRPLSEYPDYEGLKDERDNFMLCWSEQTAIDTESIFSLNRAKKGLRFKMESWLGKKSFKARIYNV